MAPRAPSWRPPSAPGWRARRSRSRSTARCATSRVRCTTARRSTIVTSRDPESLELIRHDTAHVLAAAILDLYPGTKISIGPPIEDGFYYDFEFPDGVTVSEHDFEAIEARMREHVKADEVFEREDVTPGAAMERFTREGQDYKVELIEDLVKRHRGPDGLALHQRAVHRPLPRAARAVDQAHPRVQAAQRGRRVLARRREPPDAHARLRHRLPLQGGARGAPRAPRAGPRPRPPQAGPRARAVPVLRALARLAVLAAQRHGDLERADRAVARGERRPRLPRGQDADPLRRRAVQDLRPLGRVPGEHVLHRRRGPPDGPEAHELPGAHPDLQVRAALLPRPADPLLRGGARPPPRAQRHAARPPARPPHHPGRRPHLLHRGADPGRGQPLPGLRLRDLRPVRLRAAAGALHPAREAHRHRGDVGPGREGARATRSSSAAWSSTSTRATARSTARRSTST